MAIQSLTSLLKGFWRIIMVILMITMMSYLALKVVDISQQAQQHQESQQQNLTNLLLSQTASSAAPLIQEDNADALYTLASQVISEPFVHDVKFYNNNGVQLLSTENPLSMDDILTMESPLNNQKLQYQLLVSSVIFEQQPVGFVSITFEPKYSNAWSDLQYLKSTSQIYIALTISFLCGILFTITILNTWSKKRKDFKSQQANS